MHGKRELKTERKPRLWLIPACAGAALVGAYAGFCVAAGTSGVIAPRTVVGGQDVGGMTRAEAARSIDAALDAMRAGSGVHVKLEDGEEIAYLTYDELGVTFDAGALADEAYESGHTGNALADGWNLLAATLGRRTTVTPEPDDGWEEKAAEKLAEAGRLAAEDFSYEVVGGDTLMLTKARDGRSVDRATLKARLDGAEADASGARSVDLPYTVIAANQGDLGALNALLGGEMANAKYDAETETIIPERPSLNFNVTQAQLLLDAAAPGEQVSVPAEASTPTVTAEELEQVLFRDVLGTYTTTVSGSAGRRANVRITAERVNGAVLNSGEVFDYRGLCGPFTAANGYQPAPGYLGGKTVDMDGGGACQCSSTTYAAALLANLEIVERAAHGFASSYIGLGLDATVSDSGPNFMFRNNTAYPVKVEAVYSNNRLTVSILGTKTDDTTVKMRVVTLSSTPAPEDEIVESDELAPGESRVEQTAYTGYVVDAYRQIYDGQGKLISETYEAKSRYKPRGRIVLVGPDTVEEPEETSVETSVEPPAEPVPAPTDLPGGITPAPIEEQIDQLTSETDGGSETIGV